MARTYNGLLRYNRIIAQYRELTGATYNEARAQVARAKEVYKGSYYEEKFYTKLEHNVFFQKGSLFGTMNLFEYEGEKLGVVERLWAFYETHSKDVLDNGKTFGQVFNEYLDDKISYAELKDIIDKLKQEIRKGLRTYKNGD